jgi:hypothetical protein
VHTKIIVFLWRMAVIRLHLPTSWSIVVHEKPPGSQLVMKFLAIYEILWRTAVIRLHLPTSWSIVLREKPPGSQLVMKFLTIYETRMFITAFTRFHHLPLSCPCTTIHFLKMQLNTLLPFTLEFSKLDLSLRFPHQNPVCTSPSYRLHVPSHLILLNLITWVICGEQYRSLSFSLCNFLYSPLACPS